MYVSYFIFFFNDTATTEIYTLSLHDALPISTFRVKTARSIMEKGSSLAIATTTRKRSYPCSPLASASRSEEHTSELQSQSNLVCRLLLEKKKYTYDINNVILTLSLTE